jgi:hypothetical protein
MNKRILFLVLFSIGLANWVGAKNEKPNIIFLLADDLRHDLLGCMGNRHIRTPHLDRLGQKGSIFEQAYVTSSICWRKINPRSFLGFFTLHSLVESIPPRLWCQSFDRPGHTRR